MNQTFALCDREQSYCHRTQS